MFIRFKKFKSIRYKCSLNNEVSLWNIGSFTRDSCISKQYASNQPIYERPETTVQNLTLYDISIRLKQQLNP